ncbi:Lrp/AsnC family transcriptional regulator, leucine-responsive regulatory protein [Robiginitalea myxolifaciens]|uniref:Lrp/AsnC family transcriptional regulator, leucine-responsive regulatory protein n=1 Tax=Robiginitalea myxolifaciens TaxID=400055 RepID=A0A1I6HA22_9FLAO|nr:Lrp/AsnC family transcriptional regulator [Robiginitalea myxolifaciens]SFR51200.1 Lrp/AsnC family transcriptional regulator, leucine-responsive regulatory protein [Robiginitalea myxolifaciens]
MDALNRKILGALQRNARISFTALGQLVGLTPPAVAERVKRLEDSGVIEGYWTQISHQKSGYQLKAIITLKAFMGKLKPFLEQVTTLEEVVNCYRITGNENIIMEVVLRDQSHLEEFIDQLIRYGETRTHIILSEVISNAPIKAV